MILNKATLRDNAMRGNGKYLTLSKFHGDLKSVGVELLTT